VKAAQPLFQELRKTYPDFFFLITTTSSTGHAEAKRSLSSADAFAYLPIDFSFVVRRWVKKLNPKIFIFIESDFWPNLLRVLKKNGTKIYLVSGKMSPRSSKRLSYFSFFAKKLFAYFDQMCVQNQEHYDRFLPFIQDKSRLHIAGNLKMDIQPLSIEKKLTFPLPAIVISCTHAPEEELLLNALYGGPWFLILVPRHPERFEEVAKLLTERKIPFSRWSQGGSLSSLLLVDAMGQLPLLYASSRLAIVAGSYVEHVGGHNILEPILYGTPTFFGPYMQGQRELASRVLSFGAGRQVPLANLRSEVERFFSDPSLEQEMRKKAFASTFMGRGAMQKTYDILQTNLQAEKNLWE
jgi:3-deoxy-D-manno-octulosonic-acid transferase